MSSESSITDQSKSSWLLWGGRWVDAVIATGGFFAGKLGSTETLGGWLVTGAGSLGVLAAFARSAIREIRKQRESKSFEDLAIELERRFSLVLGDVVTPIAHLLGRIAEAGPRSRRTLQGQLKQKVVDSALEICGTGRTRATFFELVDDDTMKPTAWGGRIDAPRTVFRRADERGAQAFDLVEGEGRLLVADTAVPQEGIVIRDDAPYRTFLAVAVSTGERPWGMLTIDSVAPGDLEEGDVDLARALAQLLAAGLAVEVR